MNEPDDQTGWVDSSGDVWVRADDMPGQYGTWWPITCGPGWDEHGRDKVGQARTWDQVELDWPRLEPASTSLTAWALERVRHEHER